MELSDVFTRVQRQFGDESGVQVTEADILRWCNDAQQEAVLQHPFILMSDEQMTTVADQQTYEIPTPVVDIKTIRYTEPGAVSSYPLRYMTPKELDEYIGDWDGQNYKGEPVVFTQAPLRNWIKLFPVPDHSNGAMSVEFGRYPTKVVTLATPLDLPEYLHQYVVEFCMMKAFEMDEEWEAMDRKAAYVQSTLDANFARDEQYAKNTYPTITPTLGDYW